MTTSEHEITQILHEWGDGDAQAVERLFPFVYDELRRLARNYLSKERAGHTLQPTALVHEAYLRLIDQNRTNWENRTHFYAVAATLMRRFWSIMHVTTPRRNAAAVFRSFHWTT